MAQGFTSALTLSISLATSDVATGTLPSPTTSSSEILAANSNRKGGWVTNIGDVIVYIGLGYTAVTNKPVRLLPGETLYLTTPSVKFTGAVNAITASGTGSLEVVEL